MVIFTTASSYTLDQLRAVQYCIACHWGYKPDRSQGWISGSILLILSGTQQEDNVGYCDGKSDEARGEGLISGSIPSIVIDTQHEEGGGYKQQDMGNGRVYNSIGREA